MVNTAILVFKIGEILFTEEPSHITVPNWVKISHSIAEILQFFKFYRWPTLPSWILEFINFICWWVVMPGGPSRITVPNFVKIGSSLLRYCDLLIFKMAAATILVYKVTKFYLLTAPEGRDASVSQISSKLVNWLWIQIFCCRHLGISNFRNFISCLCLEGLVTSLCQISSKLIHPMWRYCDFSRWSPSPSLIFEIAKFYLLSGSRGSRCICMPIHQNQSISCEDIKIFFDFSRWQLSAILYLFGAYLDDQQRVLGGLCPLQNLVMIDTVILIIWTFQYFQCFWWDVKPCSTQLN